MDNNFWQRNQKNTVEKGKSLITGENYKATYKISKLDCYDTVHKHLLKIKRLDYKTWSNRGFWEHDPKGKGSKNKNK